MSIRHRRTARRLMVMLAPLGAASCGHALMQTGDTEPVGKVGVTTGISLVQNEVRLGEGSRGLAKSDIVLAYRAGIGRNTDIGFSPYLGLGGRLDAKMNLAPERSRYSIAPRLGGGYALAGRNVLMILLGAVGSIHLGQVLEPYAGITFANHWVSHSRDDFHDAAARLGPGDRLAPRQWYGDGLLQTAVGLRVQPQGTVGFLIEYQHWFVMQDNPGDFFTFVPCNVVSLGFDVDRNRDSRDAPEQ